MPVISSLFVYPIKSCRGLSLTCMRFDSLGPQLDRRLMVVDANGQFLSLRTNPLFAQIQPYLSGGKLLAEAPGMPVLEIPKTGTGRITATVWEYTGDVVDLGQTAAQWFSRVLGEPCRLVRCPDNLNRRVAQTHTQIEAKTGFSDGYPLLLTSIESLSELNRRLESAVPMHRFRPNVVVRNCRPFEEDTWASLKAINLRLHLVKGCARCVAITVDQDELETSKEPLATLAQFRRRDGKVLFGQNTVTTGSGFLRVGQHLDVLSRHPLKRIPDSGTRRNDS